MKRLTRHLALIVLAVTHAVLALAYASETPYRTGGKVNRVYAQDIGAPDERQHANYIQNLLDGRGFPVFDPNDPNRYETYENHQPPLYYLLAAGWCKAVGIDDVSRPDVGLKLRSLGAITGAGTVVGAFFLAFWGFDRRDLGLVAAAFVALLPMLAAIDGSVGNDPLLFCLSTWSLAICALAMRQGWNWRRGIGIGALLGLAILTKSSAVALLPIGLYAVFAEPTRRPRFVQVCAALAVIALLVGPWWLRNQRLYGDPLAIGAFNRAFVGSPTPTPFVAAFGIVGYWVDWVGWWTARSFFGVFGYMDVFLRDTVYRLLIAATLVLCLGWFLSLKEERWKDTRKVQMLTGTFFAITLALFLRFNTQYFQAQARYLFPAIAPIAIALGIGLLTVTKDHWKAAIAGMTVALVALNAYALSVLPTQFAARTDPTELNRLSP